ncbi:MAG: hypothetical protein ACRDLB_09125 [Actinomycetota bacterium]
MEESESRRGSAVAVLVLVVMALVSLQGLSALVSDTADDPEPPDPGAGVVSPGGDVTALPLPSPAPSPSPTPAPEDVDAAGTRFVRTVHSFPRRCLRAGPRPSPGHLAAFQGGRVSVSRPEGDAVTQIDAAPPIGWSPSGSFLATGGGELWRANGRRAGSFLPDDADLWMWSPVSDCALAVNARGRLLVVGPGLRRRTLFERGGVEDLAFSPDGRRLGFVLAEAEGRSARSIWIADLAGGPARRIERYTPRTPVVALLGWDARGRRLFYATSSGASLSADGIALRYHAARGGGCGRAGVTMLPLDAYLTRCGDRDLVVVGPGRETNLDKRLAYLTPTGPSFITPTDATVISPSCSPGGEFIAAVAARDGARLSARRLVVLRPDGSFERFLAPEGFGDAYPRWGPAGTGLSFIRQRPSGRIADVWFIREGAAARPTPLVVAVSGNVYGHFNWARVFDWSADPPALTPAF